MSLSPEMLARLRIDPAKKSRQPVGPVLLLVMVGLMAVGGVVTLVFGRSPPTRPVTAPLPVADASAASSQLPADAVLTVSGYVIPRERIELSPRFVGTVRQIHVKKGDRVKKGDVLVELEDDEYRARVLEARGRLALAEANLSNAEANLRRALELQERNVESAQVLDEARRAREVAAAEVMVARGQLALAETYLNWCTIRAPIDGVILERLVDPNELVAPQSFGGTRGPSTAFVAMADLNDLQVEVDLNEADVSKVRLGQRCRISPEAYPEKRYRGYVAEIAPEANRAKGTLQVKVQVEKPDEFLTPELTARVDFLSDEKTSAAALSTQP
ncbi:MAG: efflux RND transporter periplasmic adaptor subunit [Verrucomicrobiae bacterium]|nr:efflux RND transporter periplasmic adaptor subunit [Verrucomicrobiae bacterium]MDW8344791.1 efflux RND transporter periplasmic adaptor subunit [Verrucomicrobiae bacterium]